MGNLNDLEAPFQLHTSAALQRMEMNGKSHGASTMLYLFPGKNSVCRACSDVSGRDN